MLNLKIKELNELMNWKIRDLEDSIMLKEWDRAVILAADLKELAAVLKYLEDLMKDPNAA